MGLEALSRGAQNVWLNEPNRVATRVLQKNVERWHEKIKLDVGQTLQVTSFDFTALVTRLLALPEQSGLVLFFDPPYENHRMYQDFWTAVQGFAGEVWVESDELKGVRLNDQRQHMSEIIKEVSQGDHWLVVGRARARQS